MQMNEFLKLVLKGLPVVIPLHSDDEGGHGTHPLLPPYTGDDLCVMGSSRRAVKTVAGYPESHTQHHGRKTRQWGSSLM